MHRPLAALIDLTALWAAVLATIVLFAGIRAVSGLLLIPYFLWLSFAWAINLGIVLLN
jgi:translocator protein